MKLFSREKSFQKKYYSLLLSDLETKGSIDLEAQNCFERIILGALNNHYLSRVFLLPFVPLWILPVLFTRYIGILSLILSFIMMILSIYLTIRFENQIRDGENDKTTISIIFIKYISIPIALVFIFISTYKITMI